LQIFSIFAAAPAHAFIYLIGVGGARCLSTPLFDRKPRTDALLYLRACELQLAFRALFCWI